MTRLTRVLLSTLVLTALSYPAWSQATWEGPTGVFLNPLALTLAPEKAQASAHYLNLQPYGTLTTFGGAYGITDKWEAGITHAALAVSGTQDLTIFHTKYVVLPFKGQAPQVAVGAILRDASGGDTTSDFYLTATKVFPGSVPVIASLTLRSTDGLGSGLFGKADDRTTEFGGFLGFQVTPRLILGAEVYEQPQVSPWQDLAARWTLDSSTFVDAGLARLNDTFNNQLALALTHQW